MDTVTVSLKLISRHRYIDLDAKQACLTIKESAVNLVSPGINHVASVVYREWVYSATRYSNQSVTVLKSAPLHLNGFRLSRTS